MPGKLILQYLARIKNLISAGKWTLIPRKKNLDSLSNNGLTIQDVKNELLSLSLSDYQNGPVPDYSYSGDVWIFERHINGTAYYIKLKIDITKDGVEILKCLSFHEEEM